MAMAENIGVEEVHIGRVAAGARLRLRRATGADCQLLWEWCNDAEVRARSFDSDPITFAEHRRWLARKLADPRCIFFIALNRSNVPIGQVRYDLDDESAVVSVSVDSRIRGHGLGAEIIRRSAEKIFSQTEVHTLNAFIKQGNEASVRAFEKSGYRAVGSVSMRDQPAIHLVLERPR